MSLSAQQQTGGCLVCVRLTFKGLVERLSVRADLIGQEIKSPHSDMA